MEFQTFFVLFGCLAVNAHPTENEEKTCKLVSLMSDHLNHISLEINSELGTIDDPLHIRNQSITVNGSSLIKGTYTLANGVVEGLSTLTHDLNFELSRLSLNATLKQVQLTGIYEIIDGETNLSSVDGGVHNYSGKGALNARATNIFTTLGFNINLDAETQYISIEQLNIDFEFGNASITAENLVVDGTLVDWNTVNQDIRPLYETLWVQGHSANMKYIQKKINELLEGCTLMDLLQLAKPRPPPSQQ